MKLRPFIWPQRARSSVPLVALLLSLAPALRATSVVPPAFAELVAQADYVVRAVVKSTSSRVETGADGSRLVFTSVELDVKRVLTGSPPQPLVLKLLGGRVGDYQLVLEGAPELAVGDEGYFFVQGNQTQIYPLVRLMHGLYRIEHDTTGRAYVARSNHSPLQQATDVAQPMLTPPSSAALAAARNAALSPSDFEAAITGQATSSSRREK